MTQWFTQYVPVKNPAEDKRGWNYPFQGDDWPAVTGWYWVWAGPDYEYHPEPYPSTPPVIARWDDKKQQFFVKGEVYAWRNAVADPY